VSIADAHEFLLYEQAYAEEVMKSVGSDFHEDDPLFQTNEFRMYCYKARLDFVTSATQPNIFRFSPARNISVMTGPFVLSAISASVPNAETQRK